MKLKDITRIAASSVACLLVVAGLRAQTAGNDKTEIRSLEARLSDAINHKNIDGIMSSYVNNESLFVFDLIPPRQYVGARAYKKNWQDVLAMPGQFSYKVEDLEIEVDGDLAYGHKITVINSSDPSGEKSEVKARVTEVYKKTSGKWVIVQEHSSVPVDLATGKADLSSEIALPSPK